jgi:hypothetical protein
VPSPTIFTEVLLAPTVPSDPRPKNTARRLSGSSVENEASTGRLVWETSSAMPTVKWLRGVSAARPSRAALAMAGVNSLEASP